MRSVKFKLLLIFGAIIFAVSASVGGVAITAVTGQLLQEARDHLLDMARQEAKYIKARVEGRLDYISALAKNPILLDPDLTFEQKTAFFEAEAQKTGYLA